jgi:hypothetical protein
LNGGCDAFDGSRTRALGGGQIVHCGLDFKGCVGRVQLRVVTVTSLSLTKASQAERESRLWLIATNVTPHTRTRRPTTVAAPIDRLLDTTTRWVATEPTLIQLQRLGGGTNQEISAVARRARDRRDRSRQFGPFARVERAILLWCGTQPTSWQMT